MNFSVIIPSRNRPNLLRYAIESVLRQTHGDFEVIVVNDGSEGEHAQTYSDMAIAWPGKVRFINLENAPNGHGPSYSINRGVEQATGEYVCFLDDDDTWTDPEHLARAWQGLTASSAELYLAMQQAYLNDTLVNETLWLNGFPAYARSHQISEINSIFLTSPDKLIESCKGKFAHLNTLITRRSLYLATSGMDEHIRYECEWDLYLRLCESARSVLFCPKYIARHNVPNPAANANVSTGMPFLRKMLYRTTVLDKALMFNSMPTIRKTAATHKIYTLKKIAEHLAKNHKYREAIFYAREAAIRPIDIKWRIYTALLQIKSLLSNRSKEST